MDDSAPTIRDRIKEFRRVPASDLRPNAKNWRTHGDEQRAALAGVLSEIGIAGAVIARECDDGSLELIDGHLRAETLPDALVPVLVLDVTEAEADKLLVTLDPLAALAGTDGAKLSALLDQVDSESAAVTRLLADLAEQAIAAQPPVTSDVDADPQIDRAEELRQKWGVESGQLWQLGEHRLLCGDMREGIAIDRLLGESLIDMVFTDPPYGHNNNNNGDLIHNWEQALGKKKSKSSAARPIANDGPEANQLVRDMFALVAARLKPGCCCCCSCGGGGPAPQFARWSLWLDEAIPFKMCVIWDKGGLGMGWHYRRNYECVLIAQQAGAAAKWFGGHDVPNVIRDIGKIIPSADQHPTEKPPELAAFFLRLHSEPGDLIFEPFAGSGSTLIAAEQLGRRCYAIEISASYCAVILQRFLDATGKTPVLIESR